VRKAAIRADELELDASAGRPHQDHVLNRHTEGVARRGHVCAQVREQWLFMGDRQLARDRFEAEEGVIASGPDADQGINAAGGQGSAKVKSDGRRDDLVGGPDVMNSELGDELRGFTGGAAYPCWAIIGARGKLMPEEAGETMADSGDRLEALEVVMNGLDNGAEGGGDDFA
jgi:hypothetical protein